MATAGPVPRDRPPREPRGVPAVAVLLTCFLPGAGHVYLGRPVLALVGFALVEGLYAAGLFLTGGRTFELLDPELRGALATALTPEVGNLGALLFHVRRFGFGLELPEPFPPHMLLGGWLTAVSGFANVLLAVHAHFEARLPRGARPAPARGPHPAVLVGLAWLVPGLGHLAQGRVRRGLAVLVLLVGLFAWGTAMAEGSNLSRERHFYYWSGQFLVGLPAFAAEEITGRPPVTREIPLRDAGLLFACMAGLLNVLAMLDVHGVAERRRLGIAATRQPAGADEPAEAAA